jgi:glucose-1-phosphate adenylyltransferase
MGIGNGCVIHRAIVDKNCRVGNNVVIKGSSEAKDTETDTYVIRDGIIVLKKGVLIPNGTVIEG